MRILRGQWEGRHLVSPSGRVRPTSEEVRDAWITELQPELKGARILELYAGTGAVGLEAMSRGAARGDFVENNPSALHALKANITALKIRNAARIFKHDAFDFVKGIQPAGYDIVFADPPYHSKQLDNLIERWLDRPYSRILTVEHAWDHRLPEGGSEMTIGDTTITFYESDFAPPETVKP
jgi:16S rRNA (guanine966-N2)-methyltransferase